MGGHQDTEHRSRRRAYRQDALLACCSVGFGVLCFALVILPGASVAPGRAGIMALIFIGLCLAQVFRRRSPVAALAVGTALVLVDARHGPSLPSCLVYADLLYASALHGPPWLRRHLFALAAAVAGCLALTILTSGATWSNTLNGVAGAALMAFVPVAWGAGVRHHRDVAALERHGAEQAARIVELDRATAVQAERARIAGDLHDVVASHVSSIALQCEAALASGQGRADPEALRQIHGQSVEALQELRAMIRPLRAEDQAADDSAGKLQDLGRLIHSTRANGVDVEVVSSPIPEESVPAGAQVTAYRILQEALINASKHAPGSIVVLDLRLADAGLTIDVSNELPVAPAAILDGDTGGQGMVSMRERAEALGGTLSAGADDGVWRVHAELPLAEK